MPKVANTGSGWLNPLNKMAFRVAVRARNTHVKISHKEQYIIEYLENDKVLIRRDGQFAPRGYFRISQILGSLWIMDDA